MSQPGGGSHELPSYEYFEENQNRFQISRSYGDIAQSHEKQGIWVALAYISSSRINFNRTYTVKNSEILRCKLTLQFYLGQEIKNNQLNPLKSKLYVATNNGRPPRFKLSI